MASIYCEPHIPGLCILLVWMTATEAVIGVHSDWSNFIDTLLSIFILNWRRSTTSLVSFLCLKTYLVWVEYTGHN